MDRVYRNDGNHYFLFSDTLLWAVASGLTGSVFDISLTNEAGKGK